MYTALSLSALSRIVKHAHSLFSHHSITSARLPAFISCLNLTQCSCPLIFKLGVELIAAADGWDVEA